MGSVTVRRLDDDVIRDMRVSAAKRGVSMEQEARDRLSRPLSEAPKATGLGEPEWHLRASLEEILALGRKLEKPIDHKAESDALYDYLNER